MRWLFLGFLWCISSGCFTRWVMTERELKKYYKDKPVRPTYFTIRNDSVKLFCATAGADTLPPLILIHGAPGAWYGSRNLLDDSVIQKQYHIISVDRPGYNKSRFRGRRSAVTSIELQAIAIHEALRLNRSFRTGVVMGSSYGAPIAAKMALLYPKQFHHLVMLAPAIDPAAEKFWWFHPLIKSGLVRLLFPRFLQSATTEKFAHVKELEKLLPEWRNLSISATVVQGDADDIVDPSNLEFAKKQLADKEVDFILIPGARHLIRWQHADLVRTILIKAGERAKPSAAAGSGQR